MNRIFAELDHQFIELFASIPRPIAPMPPGPVTEPRKLPDHRTDFERDDAATGV